MAKATCRKCAKCSRTPQSLPCWRNRSWQTHIEVLEALMNARLASAKDLDALLQPGWPERGKPAGASSEEEGLRRLAREHDGAASLLAAAYTAPVAVRGACPIRS